MGAEEWQEYSIEMKKGFVKCNEYLQNKHDLLEKASLTLKDSFSVEYILSYCMDKNNFQDLSFQQRQMFTKEVFEIYFSYSKNILLYFDIYSQKSITEGTSQVVNYLSKIPGFSTHLALIGYIYQDDRREWRYLETRLTGERREILLCITVCCYLGHSYIDEPSKFLELTIFERRRLSLQRFIEECVCEYCDFEFNKEDYSCTGCNLKIEKMDSFKYWELNFNTSLKEIYQSISQKKYRNKNDDIMQNQNDNDMRHASIISENTWKCPSCTLINKKYDSVCVACFTLRNETKDNIETLETILKQNMEPKDYKRHPSDHSNPPKNWTCPNCTLINKGSQVTCIACFDVRKDFHLVENTSSSLNMKKAEEKSQNMSLYESKKFSSSPILSKEKWKCSSCTLINTPSSTTCKACLNSKEDINIDERIPLNTNQQNNYNALLSTSLIEESLTSEGTTDMYNNHRSFGLKSRGPNDCLVKDNIFISPKTPDDHYISTNSKTNVALVEVQDYQEEEDIPNGRCCCTLL